MILFHQPTDNISLLKFLPNYCPTDQEFSCLIPRLLVVSTQELEILVTINPGTLSNIKPSSLFYLGWSNIPIERNSLTGCMSRFACGRYHKSFYNTSISFISSGFSNLAGARRKSPVTSSICAGYSLYYKSTQFCFTKLFVI